MSAVAAPVEIVVTPEPFTTRVERLEAQEGATVAQILLEACKLNALDPQDLCRAEVFLDGIHLTDRTTALDVRPRPGQMLNIAVLPQGGGGNGNKILSTVLEVALIAATAWIAGPAAPGIAAALNVSATAVRVGAIAVQLAGGLVISELTRSLDGWAPNGLEGFGR